MLHDDVYSLYLRHPQKDGTIKTHPAGRYLISDGHITHLEDNYGHLGHMLPEGMVTKPIAQTIESIHRNPYFDVVSRKDVRNGTRLPHDIPEADIPEPPTPSPARSSVFQYHRVGMDKPHILEMQGHRGTLDGKNLEPEEISSILSNIQTGAATLRYHRPASMAKSEVAFRMSQLSEREMARDVGLEELAKGKKDVDLDPAVHSLLHEDPQAVGAENKFAFHQFILRDMPGAYISLNANDFGAVNENHGREVGDAIIRVAAGVLRDTLEKTAKKKWKLYRIMGCRFLAYLPDLGLVAKFLGRLRDNMERIPPLGGSHKVSFTVGTGDSYPAADRALQRAKSMVMHPEIPGRRLFEQGQTPMLVYSMIPGQEGPVPAAARMPTVRR